MRVFQGALMKVFEQQMMVLLVWVIQVSVKFQHGPTQGIDAL